MSDTVRVVLDTNFALIPAQTGVDIFEGIQNALDVPYELYVLDKCLMELEKIKDTGSGADKRAAQMALSLLESKGVKTLKSGSDAYADDELVRLAKEGCIVATQDQELKRRLKELEVPIVILRQRKFVELRR